MFSHEVSCILESHGVYFEVVTVIDHPAGTNVLPSKAFTSKQFHSKRHQQQGVKSLLMSSYQTVLPPRVQISSAPGHQKSIEMNIRSFRHFMNQGPGRK